MRVSLIIACAAAPLLSGCIARTAVDVVTAPVRAWGAPPASSNARNAAAGTVMRAPARMPTGCAGNWTGCATLSDWPEDVG